MGYQNANWLFCALITAVCSIPAVAQRANLPADVTSAIADMGPTLSPEVVRKSIELMRPLQAPRDGLAFSKDVAYGPDPLQKMDIYERKKARRPRRQSSFLSMAAASLAATKVAARTSRRIWRGTGSSALR